MPMTLAFDVYGTLIDTTGVTTALSKFLGEQADAFSNLWRQKQLEYSFRRGLMRNYRDFTVCTENALEYVCQYFHAELTTSEKQGLLNAYDVLPAFPDAKQGLSTLGAFRLVAFSNGPVDVVSHLLENADIHQYFKDVISVDEIKSFKPDPAVYCHLLRRSASVSMETRLISSNPFDVIGALSAGITAIWLKRSPKAIFDPWELQPTMTISNLTELNPALRQMAAQPI